LRGACAANSQQADRFSVYGSAITENTFTRRSTLAKLGGVVLAAAGGRALLADDARGGNRAIETGAVQCVLTPELTEGPYYVAGEKLRRDIREGHPGTLLTLHFTVLNAATCRPIKGAAVDIWHADAAGNYSAFGPDTSSRTFLRGIQKTDGKGLAVFTTIYPGWYRGRAVHIHVKVHVGGSVVHTGQVFFSDALTKAVYKAKPYASRGNPDTPNARDAIYVNGGKRGIVAVKHEGGGYLGTIAMGVHK
jgi:protocatechuate 3,4-dioxygenase beta subunit